MTNESRSCDSQRWCGFLLKPVISTLIAVMLGPYVDTVLAQETRCQAAARTFREKETAALRELEGADHVGTRSAAI